MIVTATEFKKNLGHYFEVARGEDVYITKNGKNALKLGVVEERPKESIARFFGSLPKGGPSLEETRLMRIRRKL